MGVDVLVGKDGSGKLFCVGNLCPHIGTPMSEGADVIGDVIVCPLHGSSFKVTTGELIDWCPSPPIIGPLTGLPIEKKNLAVFDIRTAFFVTTSRCSSTPMPRRLGRRTIGRASWMRRARTTAPTIEHRPTLPRFFLT